jgi:rhamnosyltransferase
MPSSDSDPSAPTLAALPGAVDAGRPPVWAVIVSFNPDDTIVESVARLGRQVDGIVVVDNGSAAPGRGLLEACARVAPVVAIIWNPENLGIARALNQGVAAARQSGAQWVLTLDDDSLIEDGYVAQMLETYDRCRRTNPARKIGILAPRYVYKDKPAGLAANPPAAAGGFRWLREAITSGNLVRADVFAEVGPYRDELFIDYVDFEFCLRIRRSGYGILEADRAVLRHAMGSIRTTTILGIPVVYTTYSPVRRYYKTRNRVWCWKTFAVSNPAWVGQDVLLFVWEVAKIILTENALARQLRSVARGMADGLGNRTGRREL